MSNLTNSLLLYVICFIATSSNIQCQSRNAVIPKFKAPKSTKDVAQWEKQGEFWYLLDPASSVTPRVLSAITGPEFNVYSFRSAFKDLESSVDVQVKRRPTFEKLEAYEKWDGTDLRISLTPTTYGGVDGILFLLISKPPKDKNYHMIAMEVAEETYKDWGGVAGILVFRGIIDSVSAFPKNRLKQIANAPLSGQVKLYEETVNALQEKLLNQMVTLSNMQTLQLLQNIQFDQILNNEMTSPFEH